jgi:hypothetical protein
MAASRMTSGARAGKEGSSTAQVQAL